MSQKDVLFTIGYEGRTLQGFVRVLREASVTQVIDVRELPLSRRKGFSKTPLSAALGRAGIAYRHIRSAGNPFRHEAGDHLERCLALYSAHLDEHPEITEAVIGAAAGERSALLCAEANPAKCHRSILAKSAAGLAGVRIHNL
ncbi:MAG: DUF488 domain-containing protein [Anaeromyxobacteraceae bacterium]